MEYISEYDYSEIKTFTLEELYKYLNIIENNRCNYIKNIDSINGEENDNILEIIKEYDAWIIAYNNEIMDRLIIRTPLFRPKIDRKEYDDFIYN
jgi:hypothetical protein